MKVNFRLMLSHTMIIKSMVLLVISSLANIAIATSLPLAIDEVPVPSLAPMLEKVQASLVTVSSEATVQVRRDPFDDPFFRRFFDQRRSSVRKREMQSVGVIIDAEQGYVLTNEHAIRGASSIDVKLEAGRVFEGVLVGIDPLCKKGINFRLGRLIKSFITNM